MTGMTTEADLAGVCIQLESGSLHRCCRSQQTVKEYLPLLRKARQLLILEKIRRFGPQEMHQVCHKDLTSYLNKSDGRKKKGPESQVEMGIEPKTPRVCSQQRANTVCAPHCQRSGKNDKSTLAPASGKLPQDDQAAYADRKKNCSVKIQFPSC
ncbi:hypothetical protein Y1Q_0000979 [Alligator mississippiensis]|uniref:Uncharacterized protein n=1 Tax=Alligator mississippiensis TaxID=8496 RepID=A0A151NE47_ALLMI|nr:hypothetical protein Y1Q_0000979 [Alligator mississippiensis]